MAEARFLEAFRASSLVGLVIKGTEVEMVLERSSASVTFTVPKLTAEADILSFCNKYALERLSSLDDMPEEDLSQPVFVPLAQQLRIPNASVDPVMKAAETSRNPPLDHLRRFGGRMIVSLTFLPFYTVDVPRRPEYDDYDDLDSSDQFSENSFSNINCDSASDYTDANNEDELDDWADGYLDLVAVYPGELKPDNISIGPCDTITFTLKIHHYRQALLASVIADVFPPTEQVTMRNYDCNSPQPQPYQEDHIPALEAILAQRS
jgi:hypothetical protein